MRRRVYGVIIIIILLSIAALYLSYYSNSKISAPENPVKIIADGQEREYFYNLPVTGKKKLPLVIILHGGGGPLGSAELMMEKSGWKELSDREGFLAVFPQATLEHPDKPLNLTDDFSDPSRNIRDWNDGSGGTAASRKGIADTEYIVKVIDDLALKFPLDREKVYVTGFSNGASMTLRLGVEISDRVSAIAPVAGALFVNTDVLKKPVSLLNIVGSEDRLRDSYKQSGNSNQASRSAVPSSPGNIRNSLQPVNFLKLWSKLLGCPNTPEISTPAEKIQKTVHKCPQGSEIVLYRIEGMRHVYPGKSHLFSPNPGTLGNIIDATETVWEFFKNH